MRTGRLIRTTLTLIAAAAMLPAMACTAPGHAPRVAVPAPGDSVSVGYGQAARTDISGAISSLDERDLRDIRAARVEELLQGRVPGVHVRRTAGGDFTVRVRGQQTFRGTGEPLFIVDGVPVQQGGVSTALAGIAPRDVARIDVLKDAGATAIYGSQGAQGVIIITTRRHRD
ncbi:MAG TPA: TonB-dependent receptor plug domain-containing protein [Gemmatimonadaceae bacterium]|nr:TonB-dependent receptor plug domain-containing protein [Gemmatimonadaceae bacterium]